MTLRVTGPEDRLKTICRSSTWPWRIGASRSGQPNLVVTILDGELAADLSQTIQQLLSRLSDLQGLLSQVSTAGLCGRLHIGIVNRQDLVSQNDRYPNALLALLGAHAIDLVVSRYIVEDETC